MLLSSHGLYGHAHGMLERAVYAAYGMQSNGFVHLGSTASTTWDALNKAVAVLPTTRPRFSVLSWVTMATTCRP